MVPAPLEDVGAQVRRVGDLEEGDPLSRYAVQRGGVVTSREQVEGVDGQPDGRVVYPGDKVPGVREPVNVRPPGQRLKGHRKATLEGEVVDRRELLRQRSKLLTASGVVLEQARKMVAPRASMTP